MNRLRSLRKEFNLTLDELHEKSGIARSTLSAFENGKRNMNFNHAMQLSSVFGYSPLYIMGTDALLFDETRKEALPDLLDTILHELVGYGDVHIAYEDEAKRRYLACQMILDEYISNEDMSIVLDLIHSLNEKGKRSV